MSKATTFYLSQKKYVLRLQQIAAARGYLQTRGPGANVVASVSRFLVALAAGELVAVGPVTRWRTVIVALEKALAMEVWSEAEAESVAGILRQIKAEANIDDDDV